MLPYFEQPSVQIGSLRVYAFGAVVAISILVGDLLYTRRLRRLGLDEKVGAALGWYALVTGFLSAHLFALLLYFPEKVTSDPLSLLRVWEDLSSFGGMIGGAMGAALFLRTKARMVSVEERWGYLDAAAFVLPFAWAIGRVACTLAHDHPGRITSFPLAISTSSVPARQYIAEVYANAGLALPPMEDLARLGFHDLGWYELLYLALIVCPLFILLDKTAPRSTGRSPGWWAAIFAVSYAPMRILLDTLRVSDARYFGLTPGQYAAMAMLAVGLAVFFRQRHRQLREIIQLL